MFDPSLYPALTYQHVEDVTHLLEHLPAVPELRLRLEELEALLPALEAMVAEGRRQRRLASDLGFGLTQERILAYPGLGVYIGIEGPGSAQILIVAGRKMVGEDVVGQVQWRMWADGFEDEEEALAHDEASNLAEVWAEALAAADLWDVEAQPAFEVGDFVEVVDPRILAGQVTAEPEDEGFDIEGPDGWWYAGVTGPVQEGVFGPVREVARRVVKGSDPEAVVYQYQVGGQADEWMFFEWQLEPLHVEYRGNE